MPADSNRCRRCARPFASGEVAGLGVLRSRPESRGGPYLEFACPGCKARLRLIPHGNGRYAYPGEPPPPVPDDAERLPPWLRGQPGERGVTPTSSEPRSPAPGRGRDDRPSEDEVEGPGPAERPRTPNRRRTSASPPPDVPDADVPLTLDRARAVLGVPEGADAAAVEHSYRERALRLHPDKVAHLDQEFQALAERRFKELQEARDLLLGGR